MPSVSVQPAVPVLPESRLDTSTAPASSSVLGAPVVRVPPPPGLTPLGVEPPLATRRWGPRKEVTEQSSLDQATRGVSSGARSSYFGEYRQDRVPGSPDLDQLRAETNVGEAPSRAGVGSTRRILFTSDASAGRGSQRPESFQPANAATGVGVPEGESVLVRVDGQKLSAKPQEGAQAATEASKRVITFENRPTGPTFSRVPPVLGPAEAHFGSRTDDAKPQEGATFRPDSGVGSAGIDSTKAGYAVAAGILNHASAMLGTLSWSKPLLGWERWVKRCCPLPLTKPVAGPIGKYS